MEFHEHSFSVQLYVAQMYFLNNPSIDFAVGGLANVTDLPGINSILRYK